MQSYKFRFVCECGAFTKDIDKSGWSRTPDHPYFNFWPDFICPDCYKRAIVKLLKTGTLNMPYEEAAMEFVHKYAL